MQLVLTLSIGRCGLCVDMQEVEVGSGDVTIVKGT